MAAVLLLGANAPVPAQVPGETAAVLVKTTYTLIRDQGLSPTASAAILARAVNTIQLTLMAAGVTDGPQLPVLGGHDQDDLQAVATYVRVAAQAYAPRPLETLIAAALRAMIRAAGDLQGAPYTPAEFARFTQGLRGEVDGVGMQVNLVGEAMVAAELTGGGPAMRAGIHVGDVVREVNGLSIEGRTPDQVVDLLHGPSGTQIVLTIQRGSDLLRIAMARDRVREIPVRAQMLSAKIGYLRLLEFSQDAHGDVGRALTRLVSLGAQALVVDLRENGGGLVDEAVSVASFFLPRGIVATEEGRGAPLSLLVRPTDQRFPGPVVVIVNELTASASEIVAGALQDVGVSLIGARTFGKGTIQTIFPLPVEWGLRLTTARYRTRNGRPIDGVGLAPDFVVVTPTEAIQSSGDLQLATARVILTRRLEATSRP